MNARVTILAMACGVMGFGCERPSPTPVAPAPAPKPAHKPVPAPAAHPPPADTTPPKQPGEDPVRASEYTGILQGNIAAIGGESTGWALRDCPQLDGKAIELEMYTLLEQAAPLEGKRVVVSGEVFEKRLVERGLVKRIRVRSIRAAE